MASIFIFFVSTLDMRSENASSLGFVITIRIGTVEISLIRMSYFKVNLQVPFVAECHGAYVAGKSMLGVILFDMSRKVCPGVSLVSTIVKGAWYILDWLMYRLEMTGKFRLAKTRKYTTAL